MNLRQKIVVGVADIAVLAELSGSLYIANRDIENLSAVFFKYFFTMLIPTLILVFFLLKRLGSGESESS